jgi:DNA polymerase I-like protein with 3'-5' exonuclease and polymerase domains
MDSQEIKACYDSSIKITSASRRQRMLFDKWLARPRRRRLLAFDTETTSVEWGVPSWLHTDEKDIKVNGPAVFGISLALPLNNKVILVWCRTDNLKLLSDVVEILNTKSIKIAHNARFDIRILSDFRKCFKEMSGVECTYTMSRIYWDRRMKHSLKDLTEFLCPELSQWDDPVKQEITRLKHKYTRKGFPKDYVNYSFVPDELMSVYSMQDSFMALMLYGHLWPAIKSDYREVYEREKKVFHIINKVESAGLCFDVKTAKKHTTRLQRKAHRRHLKINDILCVTNGFNPNSPAQVLKSLLQLGVSKKLLTNKGKVTTEAPTLLKAMEETDSRRGRKFIQTLLDYRANTKIINTYLMPLTERAEYNNNIVLASINPTDARTGRMASRSPNLHNIPRPVKAERENPVRECFVPRPGYHNYYFDYAQMEMIVFGVYAGEERITEAYQAGEDIHATVAAQVYAVSLDEVTAEMRQNVKAVNFGIIYGIGVTALAANLKMSLKDTKHFLYDYYDEMPSIRRFQDECKQELYNCGYAEDWFGRRYHISPNQAYKAVNALVQGGCAQIFKEALINVDKYLEKDIYDTRVILPVHDEFQIESKVWVSPHDEVCTCRKVVECMTEIPQLTERGLRLRVDVSKSDSNWAEKKKVKL